MPNVEVVTAPDDPRLDDYRNLTDAELRRAREQGGGSDRGIFIAESALVVAQLVSSGLEIRSVLATPTRANAMAAVLAAVTAPIYVAEQAVLNHVGGFNIHRGVLAAAFRPEPREWRTLAGTARRVAVVEDVNDQENLGALFRNAAALGIEALFLSPRCGDPLYRRTVRVSMGHVLHLPFARLEPWPHCIAELAQRFQLVALTPAGDIDLHRLELDHRAPIAVALGAEGPGLTQEVLRCAHHRARIPMAAGVDSLNVAAASAIAFHHLHVASDVV